MQEVTLEEAKTRLGDLVQLAVNGEEVVITRDEQQIAKLVSMLPPQRGPQFGSAKGLIWMSDDFDAPLDDFKEYME